MVTRGRRYGSWYTWPASWLTVLTKNPDVAQPMGTWQSQWQWQSLGNCPSVDYLMVHPGPLDISVWIAWYFSVDYLTFQCRLFESSVRIIWWWFFNGRQQVRTVWSKSYADRVNWQCDCCHLTVWLLSPASVTADSLVSMQSSVHDPWLVSVSTGRRRKSWRWMSVV